MKKILVPCDFSLASINAFRFALDVAKQAKGIVHLLYVVELPVLHDSLLMPALFFEKAYLKDVKLSTQKRFENLIAKHNPTHIAVTSQVELGPINKIIQDYARKQSIDIIIMGSHGASGVREMVIGSNAAKIVRTSRVPVIIIKERVKGQVKRIVFPNAMDTEDQADLITRVKGLQKFFKAHLYVVWINTPLNFTADTVTREKLNSMAKQFDLKNCSLDIFNYSDTEGGIAAYSNMVKGNLIAMGTYGRTGLDHMFNRSIAENIVNHVLTPVWTCVNKEGK